MEYPQAVQPLTKRSKTVLVLVAIVVILLAGDGLLAFGLFRSRLNANTNSSGTADVATTDDPYLGSVDAPIVVVEFGDFQCPYCEQFFNGAESTLRMSYVSTGKVKFIFRDFPDEVRHPNAKKAAEAGECAHAQGKFWEIHDKIFINQSDLSVAALKRYANEIGLDMDQFNKCLDKDTYASEIEKDFIEGYNAGVQGTPTFFINGRLFEGAITAETLKSILDQLLVYYQ